MTISRWVAHWSVGMVNTVVSSSWNRLLTGVKFLVLCLHTYTHSTQVGYIGTTYCSTQGFSASHFRGESSVVFPFILGSVKSIGSTAT